MAPLAWRLLALVSALLSLVSCLEWRAHSQDPFEKCMHDPDYEQLLKVVTLGLNRTLRPRRVIVVGAGVAGLVAAKVLSDAGHKVTILEADNRIGGRILTFRDGKTGWIGELGAMRMPSSHRILHELCRSLGLNLTKFAQYDENTWIEVNEVKLRNYVVEKMPEKLGYRLLPRERGHSPEGIYQMALNRVRARRPLPSRPASREAFPDALRELLTCLTSPPREQNGKCVSECEGVSFTPPLPRQREEALRALHYVPATKVYLSFRRPFWNDEHIEGGHSSTFRPSRVIYYPPPGEGALLLASYTWSDATATFAGLSLEDALRLALDDVAALHGPIAYRLWDGSGVIKRWAEDPHSQGGFVVQPPTLWQTPGEERHANDWAVPFGRIYFAGEHTAYPHGWVETAVKSALRAAVLINNREWEPEQGQGQGHAHRHKAPGREEGRGRAATGHLGSELEEATNLPFLQLTSQHSTHQREPH
ncbi:PREDICTED: L-amino-acid oxidase [Condylura cristata]|uniref:L-amino-acid oxidase n=1 Tax=Condylura cristata TaxID=143302 RepID=UPI00064328C4|nr:PREDICTED: L-amino-acid oxidase [Condylura cristata]